MVVSGRLARLVVPGGASCRQVGTIGKKYALGGAFLLKIQNKVDKLPPSRIIHDADKIAALPMAACRRSHYI